MPNAIKYSTSAQTLALKKGNYWIGTGDVGKGPTSTTDYHNGITPPSGGYTIYLNKASGGPSIYTAANDSQLISLSNTIAGQTFATAAAALDWYSSQSDKMVFNLDYPAVVTDGLILNLDAGFTPSYPKTGSTLYDLSINGVNGSLENGVLFSSNNGGYFSFDGSDDSISLSTGMNNYGMIDKSYTIESWIYMNSVNRVNGIIGDLQYGWWGFYVESNNKLSLRQTTYPEYTVNQLFSATSLVANSWYYVVGVFDINSGMKLYINSTLDSQNSDTTPNRLGSPYYSGGRGPQFIGQYRPGDPYSPLVMNGNIAVIRIYGNKALSSSEILQNFNAQKGRFGL